ncbi:CRISPR-associated protein Cas4 [Pelagicoccus sp. SDUM812002]|uniref:CRISPR-associated protein Cas4 n=1 Tax=Pelagicoccus sp. SDUM812002 TaxID=3041266 RepID=UPI00280E686D|nr:CRISPR-associated protein Cas4 [Pelagicoccus sp. SDUM812002]MDQ8187497.1 CRISPR-associated protein Cas4 [Pelagicoccus sp. SDUM812002]
MSSGSVERSGEDSLVAISALQHWLYCPRQCALIHLERVWSENRFTSEGKVMHERAHDGPDELRKGVRIARGQHVRSLVLGLTGQCDIIEFHSDGGIVPVEYKRGKPKAHRADEVQLCAQAICLEEMKETSIGRGFLYYGKNRRRHEVAFDDELRSLVAKTAVEVNECLEGGRTPKSEYNKKLCEACSLIEQCQPKVLGRSVSRWFKDNLETQN